MSFPSWLEALLDSEEMRAADAWAIEERGIPSLELMERAGEGLAGVVARHAPAGRVAVVCGKGNNGGDGLVAARHLRAAGREVDVLLLWPAEALTPDSQAMLERLGGDPPLPYGPERLDGAGVIVDALLGTGSAGAPRDPIAGAIDAVNAADATRVAADIPSGVDASTGEVAGDAFRADATAAFHRAKPGLWIHPGKAHAGRVEVLDIGIPAGWPGEPRCGLIAPAVMEGYPRRHAGSTKFDSGVVVVVGGSRGLTGAPVLAAMGAMRTGAGYVTIAAPAASEVAITARAPVEVMYAALPDEDGALTPEAVEPALEAAARAQAVVLGPGLGRRPGALEFARRLLARAEVPVVLDADGLNALAGSFPGPLRSRPDQTVLTPHAGELSRLLGVESDDVKAKRLGHARAAAAAAGACVVLKGDDTIVAAATGVEAVSRGGAPALATAGTGDVLSGVTAAMLARGLTGIRAACAAVHVHARAGRIAADRFGADAVSASDVVGALPAALAEG